MVNIKGIFSKVVDAAKGAAKFVLPNIAKNIPGAGTAISLAIDFGALDWIVKILSKSISRITNLDEDTTHKVVAAATVSVLETDKKKESGELTTVEDKQKFAHNTFHQIIKQDSTLYKYAKVLSFAPLLIQLVYEYKKLKSLYDKRHTQSLSALMIIVGIKSLLNTSVNPMDELLSEVAKLPEIKENKSEV